MKRRLALAVLAVLVPVAVAADHAPGHKGTAFKVRVENVSTGETLKLSGGGTAPAPNSPVAWAVHGSDVEPFFKTGKKDLGYGLEALAEDGDPGALVEHCKTHKGVVATGLMNVPVGDEKPGPALPGKAFEFTITATPGQRLSLVTMFGQSNDWFYAAGDRGIALFDGKRPVSGEVTSKFAVYDAGTEVDQEPGAGADQGPRQKGPNTGVAENGKVRVAKSSYRIPKTAEAIRVTITAVDPIAGN